MYVVRVKFSLQKVIAFDIGSAFIFFLETGHHLNFTGAIDQI